MTGPSPSGAGDRLIGRLRERIADSKRRVDSRVSEFQSSVSGLGAGQLISLGRLATQDLRRLLDRGADEELLAKADDIERRMTTPAERPLPEPATPQALEAAETRLGFALHPLLRRLYLEVANGGFGPGFGIVGLRGGWTTDRGRSIEDLYEEMSDSSTENPHWTWPAGLVPIVDHGGAFACVDATSAEGRVVEWDPDELNGLERLRDTAGP